MPYTLKFSDPSKVSQVTVPDMPPGINTIDTSISLVGRAYPNYGEKIAENFLHLLENFASPASPANPIEGQLWYDTSDPLNKVLRIMDGTATSARWPSANGIYQQGNDPTKVVSSSVKVGDIWVDTAANQLKIYNSCDWTVIGPMLANNGEKTGSEAAILATNLSTNSRPDSHPVILHWAMGEVIAITASTTFTPRTVIDGFDSVGPGITVKKSGKFNGTADAALNLKINTESFAASEFLRKADYTPFGQVIKGKVLFQTPSSSAGSLGRDGIVVNTVDDSTATNYIQFYKYNNDAVLLNNTPGGKITFKAKPSSGSALVNVMTVENGKVGINTSTNSSSPSLDVFGNVRISQSLAITSTSSDALLVSGSINIDQDVNVGNSVIINGTTTSKGTLFVGLESTATAASGSIIIPNNSDQYDIGSPSNHFRTIYVSEIQGAAIYVPGMMISFAGPIAPAGWVQCDGASYDKTILPALFDVLQYTYGGSGPTFNVPDCAIVATGSHMIHYIIKT